MADEKRLAPRRIRSRNGCGRMARALCTMLSWVSVRSCRGILAVLESMIAFEDSLVQMK